LAFWIVVLTAVSLDCQAGGQAAEIEDITRHGYLSAKAMPVHATAAQQRPKFLFRFRRRFAHLPREGN
jgi:hypothetical protein